jgi:hypothetical protein
MEAREAGCGPSPRAAAASMSWTYAGNAMRRPALRSRRPGGALQFSSCLPREAKLAIYFSLTGSCDGSWAAGPGVWGPPRDPFPSSALRLAGVAGSELEEPM